MPDISSICHVFSLLPLDCLKLGFMQQALMAVLLLMPMTAALGVEVVERPVATVESGFVRHSSAALARELILLHAERSVRIAGARFRPREDAYQMEERK